MLSTDGNPDELRREEEVGGGIGRANSGNQSGKTKQYLKKDPKRKGRGHSTYIFRLWNHPRKPTGLPLGEGTVDRGLGSPIRPNLSPKEGLCIETKGGGLAPRGTRGGRGLVRRAAPRQRGDRLGRPSSELGPTKATYREYLRPLLDGQELLPGFWHSRGTKVLTPNTNWASSRRGAAARQERDAYLA